MAMVTVYSGTSCFFWLDLWERQVLQQSSQSCSPITKTFMLLSACMVKSEASPIQLFHLSLSTEDFEQFQQLDIQLENLQIDSNSDQWKYIWGSNAFSSRKAYKALSGSSQVHHIYKWLWKLACHNKRKIFFLATPQRQDKYKRILR